ncbi:hypothetical protein ACCO45_001607 [Purpureocillium lilacinum]|uniref:Uncharacterized protein n=1 Tax=Purpureocillium lilacinum TaxID=33203 RepID=A0ACC4E8E4_PURLI
MCKHILNAQVAIRSPCCRKCLSKWSLPAKSAERSSAKDAQQFEESDEYCPHCDNHFVIEAKTPKAALSVESDDVRVNNKMLKDERTRQQKLRSIFDPDEEADKLG